MHRSGHITVISLMQGKLTGRKDDTLFDQHRTSKEISKT